MQASHARGDVQIAALAAAGPQVASLDQPSHGARLWTARICCVAPGPRRSPSGRALMAPGAISTVTATPPPPTAISAASCRAWMRMSAARWRVGLATGASFSNVDVDARYSSADVESYTLGGYAGGMAGSVCLARRRHVGLERYRHVPRGHLPRLLRAAEGELRRRHRPDLRRGGLPDARWAAWRSSPSAGSLTSRSTPDSFKEHGGSLASLRGATPNKTWAIRRLGLRAATTMQWGGMQIVPHLSAAWQHAFDDVTPGAALAFATTGIGFSIDGVPLARRLAR